MLRLSRSQFEGLIMTCFFILEPTSQAAVYQLSSRIIILSVQGSSKCVVGGKCLDEEEGGDDDESKFWSTSIDRQMNCRLLQQLPDVNVMNGWQLNSLSLHFSIKGCQLEAPRCCDLLQLCLSRDELTWRELRVSRLWRTFHSLTTTNGKETTGENKVFEYNKKGKNGEKQIDAF